MIQVRFLLGMPQWDFYNEKQSNKNRNYRKYITTPVLLCIAHNVGGYRVVRTRICTRGIYTALDRTMAVCIFGDYVGDFLVSGIPGLSL